MAFVPAVPLSGRLNTFVGRSVPDSAAVLPNSSNNNAAVITTRPAALRMGVEFQTYSGGLDRVSMDPYSITRSLFKASPATLTEEEKDSVVNAALRHVFGNAHIIDVERDELYPAESKFRCGEITAKEFVRAIAKSSTYKSRFFDSVTQFRFIELNFKHLLGRAPLNQVEYSKHFKIFAAGGYEAEIDSYLDDGEYDDVFGDDFFPFTRFRGTYAPINQFNRMCSLEGGWASSDKNRPQMLVTSLAKNLPTPAYSVADGLPPIPNSEHPSRKYNLPPAILERYVNELEIAKAKALEVNVQLQKAYADLEKARNTISPFANMVADMDITQLYGRNFGSGKVKVFSGQYEGAPAGSYGFSGYKNINGPTKKAAQVVGRKEKQLEGLKQVILDLERQIAVQESGLDAPALTPPPFNYLPGIIDYETSGTTPAIEEPEEVLEYFPNAEDEDSGVVVPKKVVVSTKRRFDDEVLGKNPGELIEELTEANEGKDFLQGKGGKVTFPGDGSEMQVGG